MNITRLPRQLVALCSVIALFGCNTTGGLITSLEDLSTESVKEGLIKIPQYRVASIPGWLPFPDVGGLYFYKPNRKPASAIGLSPGKESFKLVSEIDGKNCTRECLVTLRDQITTLGGLAQELVQAQVDLSTLQVKARAKPAAAPVPGAPVPAAPGGAEGELQDALGAAVKKYDEKRAAFNAAYDVAAKAIKDDGVLVYRWTSDSSSQGSAGFGSLFGGSAQQDARRNGYALVSGIRTKTLFVGSDLLDHWQALDKSSRFSNRFEMTTHIMQGRHIVYGSVADISSFAQAKLKASYEQLAALPETLRATQAEVEVTLAKVSNLSNMGVMGKIERRVEPVSWDPKGFKQRLAENDWLTFYSVESDFTDILDLLRQAPDDKGPQRTPDP